jgi:hypothetical protein
MTVCCKKGYKPVKGERAEDTQTNLTMVIVGLEDSKPEPVDRRYHTLTAMAHAT